MSARPTVLEVPAGEAQAVIARLHCGRECEGRLTRLDAHGASAQIEPSDGSAPLHLAFAELQWIRFLQPLDPAPGAEGPHCRPFSLTYGNGQVLTGELFGYGVEKGGLDIYLADETGGSVRLFVPACAVESFAVGERLGKVLLERGQISPQGLEVALERQRMLRKQRLGALLLEQRLVSRDQLEDALVEQANRPVVPLGEVLVERGVLTRSQLDAALAAQRGNRRKPLGEILIDLELLDREALQAVLAHKVGIPCVDLRRYTLSPDWGELAPYAVCRQHAVVPLYRSAAALVVAVENPLDVKALSDVSFALSCQVVPVLARREDIDWALERHPERQLHEAEQEGAAQEAENAHLLATRLDEERDLPAALPGLREASESTLVRLVNKIIVDAHQQKASDIHFEPGEPRQRLRVRFRRDGVLYDYLALPASAAASVVSRLKVMAGLDISERRRAQDGKIDFKRFGGLALDVRIACIPTQQGRESVVLRLLASATPMPLERIGLAPAAYSCLRRLAEKPHGLILVCGPTGSGKTTTLHSLLAQVNTPENKIWTAEDPVEIVQPGLNQVQVQPGIGWTFAAALRSFLRADPDVVMVGEVRDSETARIVVEASLTGHLVLSTLHTNSAPESVTRLADMGVDPFNFADALLGVLAQRLTRRLCARCARHEPLDDEAAAALADEYCGGAATPRDEALALWRGAYGTQGGLRRARPVGCKACAGTGYTGRLALYELLEASPALKRCILRRGSAEELRSQALSDGMRTLKQDGIEKVLQGLTTIEEVRAVTS